MRARGGIKVSGRLRGLVRLIPLGHERLQRQRHKWPPELLCEDSSCRGFPAAWRPLEKHRLGVWRDVPTPCAPHHFLVDLRVHERKQERLLEQGSHCTRTSECLPLASIISAAVVAVVGARAARFAVGALFMRHDHAYTKRLQPLDRRATATTTTTDATTTTANACAITARGSSSSSTATTTSASTSCTSRTLAKATVAIKAREGAGKELA